MSARKPSDDRKAEIVLITLDLAFEVGPDHVTTGMIAKRLGVSQPAIYKHFPKKEDIWQAVTDTLCARIAANTARARSPEEGPFDQVRTLVLGHLAIIHATPALPEIMVTRDPTGNLTKTRARIHTAMGAFRAALVTSLDAAHEAGRLPAGVTVEDAVKLMFGLIQGLVLRLIVGRDIAVLESDGARLLDLQLALLGNTGDKL